MKKIFLSNFILMILIVSLCSCSNKNNNFGIKKTENLEYLHIDEDSVAIGSIISNEQTVFVPYMIDDKKVTELGFVWGMSNHFSSARTSLKRIYFPNSIEMFSEGYVQKGNIDVFYCANPIDLHTLPLARNTDVYVPFNTYDQFETYFLEVPGLFNLLQANVTYYLNYENGEYEYNEYYYIDYYENNELIKFIPPNPERKGYKFEGWFKERECINKWDFDKDVVLYENELIENKLYAKWTLL